MWEHKAHLTRPALADTDGPFMAFRKWYQQFYADGPMPPPPGDERTFPPPDWPDKMDEAPPRPPPRPARRLTPIALGHPLAQPVDGSAGHQVCRPQVPPPSTTYSAPVT